MTMKVISLDEFEQGLRGVLESCSEPGQSVVIELPNHRRVSIQNWDEDDDLIDRLLENNAEFRDMAQKSFASPRRPFPLTTDSAS
jgi:PHD/YefM family antitoxin component YafN of YafNO toxin-antitoxin module